MAEEQCDNPGADEDEHQHVLELGEKTLQRSSPRRFGQAVRPVPPQALGGIGVPEPFGPAIQAD